MQRHFIQHCGTTTKVCMVGTGTIILLSTAKLTWDWLELIMYHAEGSILWCRSGVICECDCKELIGYQSKSGLKQHVLLSQPSEKRAPLLGSKGCSLLNCYIFAFYYPSSASISFIYWNICVKIYSQSKLNYFHQRLSKLFNKKDNEKNVLK